MATHRPVDITIERVDGGLYRAKCLELGLYASGATMSEAEAGVMRLLDERMQQKGAMSPFSVRSERDTRLEPSEGDADQGR